VVNVKWRPFVLLRKFGSRLFRTPFKVNAFFVAFDARSKGHFLILVLLHTSPAPALTVGRTTRKTLPWAIAAVARRRPFLVRPLSTERSRRDYLSILD